MAEASKTVSMQVPRDALWKTIVAYERYPEFVDGAKTVKVLEREGKRTRVHYSIELMGKDISYVLDHFEESPDVMRWELVESNFMKSNKGRWNIKPQGETKTEATYELALELSIPVPGFVLNGLVKSSLPRMLSQFEAQAKKATK